MAQRRLPQTTADYVVAAVNPVLIMLLIGSLVFFLVEVFYQGHYQLRLNFIFSMFVLATVLIARIAMAEGASYAAMFAVPLALATGIAIMRFVEIGGVLAPIGWLINWGMLALIWWCAHKLTWDCTFIDETQDASGEGLLQTAGIDHPADQQPEEETVEQPQTDAPAGGIKAWFKRQFDSRRPHAPGVWVVYFSLAALPLFGLGGWFVPSENLPARRYTFLLLCVYVASGLALLMTTSFLGLRRYLRQRQVQMPVDISRTWLVVGSLLIVGLMAAAWLLPRRNPEYSITQLPIRFGAPDDLSTSPYAFGEEGEFEDHATHGGRGPEDDPAMPDPADVAGEGAGGKDGDGSATDDGSQKDGGQERGGKDGDGKSGGDGKDSEGDGQSGGGKKGGSRKDGESKDSSSQNRPGGKSGSSSSQNQSQQSDNRNSQRQSRRSSPRSAAWLLHLFKWLFYLALLIGALVAALCWRREISAAWKKFLVEWRQFWKKLFSRSVKQVEAESEPELAEQPPRPFTDYADPFVSGQAGQWSPEQLVRYSFEALQAWARQHGYPRRQEQTPLEFAQQVAARRQSFSQDARYLAHLYCQAAYADGPLPAGSAEPMRRLWQYMRSDAA